LKKTAISEGFSNRALFIYCHSTPVRPGQNCCPVSVKSRIGLLRSGVGYKPILRKMLPLRGLSVRLYVRLMHPASAKAVHYFALSKNCRKIFFLSENLCPKMQNSGTKTPILRQFRGKIKI